MDIYDTRYFIINKTFMTWIGLWPYQDSRSKFYSRILLFLGLSMLILSQFMALYKDFSSVDKVIEHFCVLFFVFAISLKFVTSVFAENKLKTVLDITVNNYEKITDMEERAILIKYFEKGRQLTIGYTIYIMIAATSFIGLPVTPLMLNKLRPLNESRPLFFILDGDYGMDNDANYGKVYAIDCLLTSVGCFIMVACDTTYTVCIEHSLAMFAIVNFASILESSYSTSFLFLMGFNMFIFSLSSVMVLIKLDQIMEFIRYSLVLIGTLVHLFYMSWPGQKLIDHSSDLFEDSYTNKWYKCSIKSQILLKFITSRCLKPCQLTAGGIYVMNFTNFLSILKASMSYITMFSSFR